MNKPTATNVSVADENGNIYLCPITRENDNVALPTEDLDECVGKDAVGRYAGNIDLR